MSETSQRHCGFCKCLDRREHDEITETWQQWQCEECGSWNDKEAVDA